MLFKINIISKVKRKVHFEMKQTYIYDKIKIVLWEFPGGLVLQGWGKPR